ncbi:MAG: riboflavin biosynthesis protein RibF [Elusimicrobia bacterium]|nr:riboflavin biosynthesis protein RibF [Elusimicrobiota bacterium]
MPGSSRKRILALGTFDGVHLGHRRLIEIMLKAAERRHLEPIVVLFPYSPRIFLHSPQRVVRLLSTVQERIAILKNEFGVEQVKALTMRKALFNLPASRFLADYAGRRWGAKAMVFGENFALGNRRLCHAANFLRYAGPLGIEGIRVSLRHGHMAPISSSRIRGLLAEGHLPEANRLLGRPYQMSGPVVRGQGIGRRLLGYPTANLRIPAQKILPLGVYQAHIPELDRTAMVNIGHRPTVRVFSSARVPWVEAHVLHFAGVLYGRRLTLQLVKKLRGERKFESLDDLRFQIARDIRAVLKRV